MIEQLHIEDRSLFDPGQIPDEVVEWETHLVDEIKNTPTISETDRVAIITARRGQGLFRKNVMAVETRCRVTKVDRPEHLVASHSKPWRDCASNDERLDGNNGLLLTPTIDHLFDRGFISFDNGGQLLISPVVHRESLRRMGIDDSGRISVGDFSSDQDKYLEFHRQQVFLDSGLPR